MKIHYTILIIILSLGHTLSAESNDVKNAQDPRLKNIYSEVRSLIRRHYPEATSHFLGAKIHFESNTRVFLIHVPLKTGEWQDPLEERGPKKGGILGEIELRNGKYGGAAVVPQTFDRRYYEVMLMAPYSEAHDCHLYVHLYVPRLDRNSEFIKLFSELVNDFEKKIIQ